MAQKLARLAWQEIGLIKALLGEIPWDRKDDAWRDYDRDYVIWEWSQKHPKLVREGDRADDDGLDGLDDSVELDGLGDRNDDEDSEWLEKRDGLKRLEEWDEGGLEDGDELAEMDVGVEESGEKRPEEQGVLELRDAPETNSSGDETGDFRARDLHGDNSSSK
jgi:hypothetical protein